MTTVQISASEPQKPATPTPALPRNSRPKAIPRSLLTSRANSRSKAFVRFC